MDKKSKIILIALFIAIAISASFLYYRHVIKNDFPIFHNDNGIPINDDA